MDPFFVPAAGVLMASGIIGGGQVAEDWNEPDGLPAKISKWDPLNFLKSDADRIRQEQSGLHPGATGTSATRGGGGVSLGFFFTKTTPHCVDEVVSLVDGNGVRMDRPHYANPEIRPGDTILYVGDMKADYAPTDMLKAALQGGRPATVTITFQRGDQAPFTATLMRHNLEGKSLSFNVDVPPPAHRKSAPANYKTSGYYDAAESPPGSGVPYRTDMALLGEI